MSDQQSSTAAGSVDVVQREALSLPPAVDADCPNGLLFWAIAGSAEVMLLVVGAMLASRLVGVVGASQCSAGGGAGGVLVWLWLWLWLLLLVGWSVGQLVGHCCRLVAVVG